MKSGSIRKEIKYLLIRNFLARPIFYFLKAYSYTLRFKLENTASYLDHLGKDGRVIFASWHQRFFGGFFFPVIFGWRMSIMISSSRDGDFISDAVHRIGWRPVRGSSTRGGRKALQAMISAVCESRLGVHIVDGPNGPSSVIKPGLIAMAQLSGAAISPAFVSYEKPIVFNSWDRFMIPKPFSRVLIRMADLEDVPASMTPDEFEAVRLRIERLMQEGYRDADEGWKKPGGRSGFRFLWRIRPEIPSKRHSERS